MAEFHFPPNWLQGQGADEGKACSWVVNESRMCQKTHTQDFCLTASTLLHSTPHPPKISQSLQKPCDESAVKNARGRNPGTRRHRDQVTPQSLKTRGSVTLGVVVPPGSSDCGPVQRDQTPQVQGVPFLAHCACSLNFETVGLRMLTNSGSMEVPPAPVTQV